MVKADHNMINSNMHGSIDTRVANRYKALVFAGLV